MPPSPPDKLISTIQCNLHLQPHKQRHHMRPHALLAPLNPMIDLPRRRIAKQARPIHHAHLRRHGHMGSWHCLVQEQALGAFGEEAHGVQLAEAVLEFPDYEAAEQGAEGGLRGA